jgi:hypothetical protein
MCSLSERDIFSLGPLIPWRGIIVGRSSKKSTMSTKKIWGRHYSDGPDTPSTMVDELPSIIGPPSALSQAPQATMDQQLKAIRP